VNADQRAEVGRIRASTSLAAVIGETVPLKRTGRLLMALCPFHGEKTPSFYVWPDHYHCFGCGAHGDVFDWLMRTRQIPFAEAVRLLAGGVTRASHSTAVRPLAVSRESQAADVARNRELARRVWCAAQDPHGTPVEAYLRHRGVRLPDEPVIRWHPACPRTGGPLPAMVAMMTCPVTGQPTGIHRTFLLPDGSSKALMDKPKMMLGRAGLIRLASPCTEGLGIAEGVETALAAMQVIGWGPVWAAGSCGAIQRLPVLPYTLTVFADSDGPGVRAARVCAARWADAGREALIHIPPDGTDWADAVRRLAA